MYIAYCLYIRFVIGTRSMFDLGSSKMLRVLTVASLRGAREGAVPLTNWKKKY